MRRGPKNSENNSQEYLNNLIRTHQIIDSIGSRQCGRKSWQFKLKGPDISERSLNMSEQFSLCAKHSLRTCKTHTLNVRTCWDCHSSSQRCYLSLCLNLLPRLASKLSETAPSKMSAKHCAVVSTPRRHSHVQMPSFKTEFVATHWVDRNSNQCHCFSTQWWPLIDVQLYANYFSPKLSNSVANATASQSL